jgi:hypothetical protein
VSGGTRLDWELETTELQALSTTLSALSAHTEYWENEDIVGFVVGQAGPEQAARAARRRRRFVSQAFEQHAWADQEEE